MVGFGFRMFQGNKYVCLVRKGKKNGLLVRLFNGFITICYFLPMFFFKKEYLIESFMF